MEVPPQLISQFVGITQAAESHARQLLKDSRLDLDAAISSFFAIQEAGGIPDGAPSSPPAASASASLPSASASTPAPVPLAPPPASDEVRAPIPATVDQLLARPTRRSQHVRDPFVHGDRGGSASNPLSALFRPPEHLVFPGDLDAAMSFGREAGKWLLVAVHNADEFACHVLNRDVWSDASVQQCLESSYVFWQRNTRADDAARYRQFYPYSSEPHVAIVDPRSGERVVVFEGGDAFSQKGMQAALTEFARTNSLADGAPPTAASARAVAGDRGLSEEEQLAAAIAASMEGVERTHEVEAAGASDDDEDARPKAKAETKRARVPDEPEAGAEGVAELLIRLPDGQRLQRRFRETDSLAGIAAFVDANAEGIGGGEYDFVTPFPRKVLTDRGMTLAEAGLSRKAVIMVHLRQ